MARRRRAAAPQVDSGKWCKDCLAEGTTSKTRRPTPYPGPRCKTHHLARRKTLSARQHGAYVEKTYGITGEQYWALYEAQGGRCYICRRASGKARRLAVDHDHETGWVRGLLCKPCNRDVVGHLRDDSDAFRRGAEYLENPPAFAVIGKVRAADVELAA
jgi:hypothetical protein